MNVETIQKLLDINDKFYQSFGAAFAETRQRIQPGVQRIIEQYLHDGHWLDMGCGNGVLGQILAQRGLQGSYLGLDFSLPLLEEAHKRAGSPSPQAGFERIYRQANLMVDDWMSMLDKTKFDGVLAFAALHHLPGAAARKRLLEQVNRLLGADGIFIHSEWQFQHSPKLMARVQPWSLVGLTDKDLEEGDTLLDWRRTSDGQHADRGFRYVHLFTRTELLDLAQSTGFKLIEEFESDGATGNLALYQVWQKIK